jgi:hypothetical protein
MFNQLPKSIWKFVQKARVGHLSVRSKYGVLVHPIAFSVAKDHMVFGTPRTAKKLDLLQKNSRISFTCDNGELMKKAIGITVIGRAETYGFDDLKKGFSQGLLSMAGFMKKYPELVKYYIRDFTELPDANKFWKYVFVRVNPTRIVHWDGYEFGRISTKGKKKGKKEEPEEGLRPEDDPVMYAKYVQDYYKSVGDLSEEFDDSFSVEAFAGDMFTDEVFMKEEHEEEAMDATTLLNLPDHLRKTGIAILKFEEATVNQIAEELGSTPRTAKNSLDRLTLMKMLNKKREGDQLVYYTR